VKLQEIMVREVIQVSPDDSVGEAAKRMQEKSVGCLVATADGAVKGIITDRDLVACLHQEHNPYECKVAVHMSRPVIVLRPEEDHITALDVMQKKRIKRLPIAMGGKLLGIVSLSDLASVAECEEEKLWPSRTFITDLIRTQAARGRGATRRTQVGENVPAKTVA
jgi:signal-transduction protein with cAMP-binding, CBS, and nucleotidyltransferase domain